MMIDDPVTQYLAFVAAYIESVRGKGHTHHLGAVEEIVLTHGRRFEWEPLPEYIEPGPHGECFRNAFELVEHDHMIDGDDQLTYVEGYACVPPVDLPVHHAWAVTPDGKVIDPTWDFQMDGCAYFGIPLTMDYVAKCLISKGTYGVLHWGMTFDTSGIAP